MGVTHVLLACVQVEVVLIQNEEMVKCCDDETHACQLTLERSYCSVAPFSVLLAGDHQDRRTPEK